MPNLGAIKILGYPAGPYLCMDIKISKTAFECLISDQLCLDSIRI